MAHKGDVCPHLHERLTSQIIASFFSESLIVSHFLSHYHLIELDSIHTVCVCVCVGGLCTFALNACVTSLNLLHIGPQNIHRHTRTINLPHLPLWSSLPPSSWVLSAFVGRHRGHSSPWRNKVIYIFSIELSSMEQDYNKLIVCLSILYCRVAISQCENTLLHGNVLNSKCFVLAVECA